MVNSLPAEFYTPFLSDAAKERKPSPSRPQLSSNVYVPPLTVHLSKSAVSIRLNSARA